MNFYKAKIEFLGNRVYFRVYREDGLARYVEIDCVDLGINNVFIDQMERKVNYVVRFKDTDK